MKEPLLEFCDICVDFPLDRGVLRAVDHANLTLYRKEILGVVGESGSGKTTLACTSLNLVSAPGSISQGKVLFKGRNLLELPPDEKRQFNWNNMAMIFQAAQNSLNPLLKIEEIFWETIHDHDPAVSRETARDRATRLLKQVRLNPEQVLGAYPHQLSGGMKQRTIIALSLVLQPDVLVLDEPTTALDVITQAYIMDILNEIHREMDVAMIFNTHDVALVGKMADRVAVMYGGQVVELGSTDEIFHDARHPYTQGLIRATPSLYDDVTTRKAIPGSPPDLINPPENCRFASRCAMVCQGNCKNQKSPEFVEVSEGHFVRCLQYKEGGGEHV